MRLPSPAMIVALIALIVAMSGSAYAVTQLPRNSVGTAQLKKNAVTAVKIKKNAVTSAKIKNGTIQTADLSAKARTELKGATGATGAQGATGATGPPGPSIGASVAEAPGTAIPSSLASLISLGSTPSASSSGPVTVSTRSRLQITGSVNLKKDLSDASNVGIVFCFAQWAPAGSSTWDDTTGVSMGAATLPQVPAPGGDAWGTISIDAFVNVDAGSYDVQLLCRSPTSTIADYAAINVVAIPIS